MERKTGPRNLQYDGIGKKGKSAKWVKEKQQWRWRERLDMGQTWWVETEKVNKRQIDDEDEEKTRHKAVKTFFCLKFKKNLFDKLYCLCQF